MRFGPSSTSLYFESVVRAQTAQGLAALGTVALPWKPDTGTLTVHKVNILRGGQVIDALAGHKFTVLRRETNLDSAMLDGILTATLQVEGLRVGDALDLAGTYETADPIMNGHSELLLPISTGASVDHLSLRAAWARPKVIRWRAGDGLASPRLTTNGGVTELTLDMRGVEPLTPPKEAPDRFGRAREIDFTDFTSWADVSALFAPLYAKAATLAGDSPLKAEAATIRAASVDPAIRAAAALALVQDKVRYVFLGMNDGGFTPAAADTIWSRRFGDCKGKTALLLALLKELGIEAQPALVTSTAGDGLEARLPAAEIFDHVVVRAVIAGRVYWLDGTRAGDRNLASLRVPPFLWALPVQATGAALVPLLVAPLGEPDALTVLKLDASAGLGLPAPAHAEIRLRGDVATGLDLKIADLAPADLDRVLRDYWTKQYDFIEAKSVKAAFDAASGEERWTMDGVAKMAWNTATGVAGKRYEADGAGLGWKADFKRDPGPHAGAPFAVDYPFFDKSIETIVLPRAGVGFVIDGDNIDKTVAARTFLRTARIDKGVFSMEASTRTLGREFPAAEAAAASTAIREMAGEGLFVRAPANYADTAQEIDALIASQPKTAAEFNDRGWALLQRNAREKAVADFDKAIALDGAAPLAYANRANARFWLGRFDEARADAEKATALDSHQEVAWRVFGLLAAREGRLSDAVAMYTRAIDEDASDVWTYRQRAAAYWELSNSDKALADLVKGLD
ncbi:MAG: DUF3857 domain-containing protein, partial [Pseudomonadota bacterium]|nr:DUF3857 domain-containing protein [Pseudomonadota bacterium]